MATSMNRTAMKTGFIPCAVTFHLCKNFLVALFCNLSRFAGLNKTWEVLSTKVDRGPLTSRRQGPSEISKLWGSFKARTVLIPFLDTFAGRTHKSGLACSPCHMRQHQVDPNFPRSEERRVGK